MNDQERLEKIKSREDYDHEFYTDEWYGIDRVDIRQEDYNYLIQQAEEKQELEEKVIELNREIGSYAGQVGEIAQAIGADIADLKILATRMCKADE